MITVNIYAVLFCIPIIIVTAFWFLRKSRKSPPGPYGLPIVGYYPFLGKDPVTTIHNLSKKYDNIMSINLLGHEFWILNSYEAIKEALDTKGELFTARDVNDFNLFLLFAGSMGIEEGEIWRSQAKIFHQHMNQNLIESTTHTVFEDIETHIDQQNGEAHDYADIVNQFTLNMINEIVCGKRLKLNDPTYQEIRRCLSAIFTTFFQHCYLHLSGTLFKYYLRFTSNVEQTLRNDFNNLLKHSNKLIEDRKEELSNESYNCKYFIDLWIKECNNPNNKHLPSENLAGNVLEMWVGNETVSGVVYNGIKLMALNPTVQDSVHSEIVKNLGKDGLFSYSDREKLPFTQAVIAEIRRNCIYLPLVSPHLNEVETTLQGYKVPVRQKVLMNTYSLMKSRKHFANPDEFDPNNFLDSDGNYNASVISLQNGTGVRMCPGATFVDVELFIVFVRLMRQYEFSFPSDEQYALFNQFEPFKVHAKRR